VSFLPRVIPCLLLDGKALVKTTRFAEPDYLGDAVNILSIFSELEVDEVVLLDIAATREGRGPDFSLLARLADECIIPMAYGGGVRNGEDFSRVLEIGFEKVALNTIVADEPAVVSRAAEVHGSQAVVVSIDARKRDDGTGYDVYVEGGSRALGVEVAEYARRAEALGAGEILLNSIDRDGTMDGYDIELIKGVTGATTVPVIACGGAGKRAQLADPVKLANASAVAAGSLFVYQGRQHGVLVNFPSLQQRAAIFQ